MQTHYPKSAGFHLIEILICVAIIGILCAITLPNYSHYLIRMHRVEAAATLKKLALALEHYQIEQHTYAAPLSALPCAEGTTHYRIVIEKANESEYLLLAIPQGKQAAQDRCGTLSLDARGEMLASGSTDIHSCWSN